MYNRCPYGWKLLGDVSKRQEHLHLRGHGIPDAAAVSWGLFEVTSIPFFVSAEIQTQRLKLACGVHGINLKVSHQVRVGL